MARQSRGSVVDIGVVAVKQRAVQPDFAWNDPQGMVAVPAVLIKCSDAVLVVEHEGEPEFAFRSTGLY